MRPPSHADNSSSAAPPLGAAVWTAPTIITAQRADARTVGQMGSRPPKHESKPPAPQMGPPLATELLGTLPFTGQETRNEAELGIAALAAGAAIYAMNRPPKRDMAAEEDR